MTKEEIKDMYSMRDIVEKYGIYPDRSGMCLCPFHSDKNPSMKIYKDSFHCFGCGANGDIFDFVMLEDDVSFSDAFRSLGGTYEKNPSFASKVSIYHMKKRKEQREKEEAKLEKKKQDNIILIDFYRKRMQLSDPLSDEWCLAYKHLERQYRIHAELNDIPY